MKEKYRYKYYITFFVDDRPGCLIHHTNLKMDTEKAIDQIMDELAKIFGVLDSSIIIFNWFRLKR